MSNILIIDTQESFVAVLAKEIATTGHQVVTARTLLQGLKVAIANPFDVIFLNAEMPNGRSIGVLPELIAPPPCPR
ncbi:MAG: response regulator [Desulfobulbus sp.]|nr:response regulator [Desulfobulbus sp.]